MKKIIRFIRNCIILILWTIFFVFIIKNIMLFFWNFNIMSTHTWNTMFTYWNKGGIFKTSSDLTLLFFLFSIPLLFIFGFIRIKKINYLKKFLSLFKIFIKQPKLNYERIIIKEKKSSEQLIEDIQNEIKSIKPEKNKEANSIRSSVLKKIKEEIKK